MFLLQYLLFPFLFSLFIFTFSLRNKTEYSIPQRIFIQVVEVCSGFPQQGWTNYPLFCFDIENALQSKTAKIIFQWLNVHTSSCFILFHRRKPVGRTICRFDVQNGAVYTDCKDTVSERYCRTHHKKPIESGCQLIVLYLHHN